jgi:hypothetical protein
MSGLNAVVASQAELTAFCRKWHITELALFGSVLREDFRPNSDVDVLVTFAPETRPGIRDRLQMSRELADLFGRPVDLIERKLVEESPNYICRQHILTTAQVVYGA